jgi:putative SOS response-associated peptidase YedK
MCGRYNITNVEPMRRLMARLGLNAMPRPHLNVPPGAIGEIVIETDECRELQQAVWSMLIEPKRDGNGYRPDPKYTTFNAQSRRLTTSPLWKRHYRHCRAILPASGFHERQGTQAHKQCMNIHGSGDNSALALANLYQEWQFGDESVISFAVITLPPHPRFEHVHAKSIPLMLEPKDFDA